MSGHSKWNNIKNKKGAMDAKKGQVFGQLSKLIRVAVREGKSGDPNANPTLRTILDKARAANMPKENIQRAIDKGLGKGKGGVVREMTYEGFGPGGVAVLVTAVTDNPNRTVSELKNAFSKNSGSLSSPGAAQYLFRRNQETEEYEPVAPIVITDVAQQEQIQKLVDTLRENEDVEEVFMTGMWEGMGEG